MGIKIIVKDTSSGGISGEVLYGNPEKSLFELENGENILDGVETGYRSGGKAPEASIYNFDCFEIVGK